MRNGSVFLVIVSLSVAAQPEYASAQGPVVLHDELRCLPEDGFTIVAAGVEVSAPIRSVKLYFRSMLYPEYYYVEMIPFDGVYAALLPQPNEETTRVVYYIEVVDTSFGSSRTRDVTVPVREPCSERSSPVATLGDETGIVVGAMSSGAGALPPGFKSAGIIGTITAAGIAFSAGGGIGTGAVVVIAAAAGGAAGVAVGTTGGSTNTTSATTTLSIGSGTSGGGTTSIPSSGGMTTSIPPSSTTSTFTTSSTSVPGTSTSSTPATSTSSTPATSTSVPATTSVIVTTTSSPATTTVAPPVACFNAATATGLCRLRLDASCSTGAIDVYSWTLDTGGALNGPVTVSGNPVEHTYGTVCLLTTVTNVLTVSGPGGNDSDSRQFMFLLHRTDGTSSSSRFETRLDGFEGAPVTGSLIVNDAIVRAAATASPETIVFPARGGENVVEALISSQARGVGYWSFDFTGDDAFVAGSLRVELGAVAAANARRIVFRLGDDQPRTIRFRFELRAAGKP